MHYKLKFSINYASLLLPDINTNNTHGEACVLANINMLVRPLNDPSMY